ncbi:retropepsin-like aspartic protease family protein [Teredinibacter haidensis]|uniref:retropepsin-like aspartic protease family protein n=1 Tax=Teredinibacter haidensis TaxID=2731755 RepID=UPI000948CD35|nr:TIGR02281 family clan AA aspartic protease [Teredinibacter haidensis]
MSEKQAPGKHIGKGMLIACWILVLAGLTLFFNRHEENRYNPNQYLEGKENPNWVDVTLERNPYGHYLANGFINGQAVTFMLDTGATDVAIPASLQRKLGLKRGPQIPVSTANGEVMVWMTEITQLDLGPIQLHNVRASLNPGMNGDEVLLGMSVLKSLDFSQQGKHLTLRQYKQ